MMDLKALKDDMDLPHIILIVNTARVVSAILSILYYFFVGVRTSDIQNAAASFVLIVFLTISSIYYKNPKLSVTIMLVGTFVAHVAGYVRDPISDELFYEIVLANFLTLFEGICIVGLLLKVKHNITRLMMIHIAYLLLFLWQCATYNALGYVEVKARVYFLENLDLFISQVGLIYLLSRSDVRDPTVWEDFSRHLVRVESSYIIPSDAYMPEEYLTMLEDKDRSTWIKRDGNPIDYENNAYIFGKRKVWNMSLFQWAGEDFVRCVISPDNNSNGSWGFRMEVMHIHRTVKDGRKMVRIYGLEGRFIDLWTEPVPRDEEGIRNKVSNFLDDMER